LIRRLAAEQYSSGRRCGRAMRTPAIERRVGDAEWAVLKEQMGIADVDRHPIGVLIGGADTKMDTSVPHPDDENLIGIALAYAGFTALHHVRAHLRPGFRAIYLSASFVLPASRSAFTNSSSVLKRERLIRLRPRRTAVILCSPRCSRCAPLSEQAQKG
jgi:hypothetical protein